MSEVEEEPDKYSSIHALVLAITYLDDSSDEEDEDMALKSDAKSLKELMGMRNKVSIPKEADKSKPPNEPSSSSFLASY